MSARTFTLDGAEVRVRAIRLDDESSYRGADERMRRGWLCLENGEERRRLAPLPESWENWREDDVRQAWQSASTGQRRSRSDDQAMVA